MLQFSVYTIPRPPTFEIKAIINFTRNLDEEQKKKELFVTHDAYQDKPQGNTSIEHLAKLEAMQEKLEQIVPASYRTKYRITNEQLVGVTITHLADQARRMAQNMEDYIHAAASELKLR